MKKILTLIGIALLAVAMITPAQGNPLVDFLNPTNSFLQAQELNVTLDVGYSRSRDMATGLGARFWISDSQGAAISYTAFPSDDKAEWQIGYGYRTAYKKLEIATFIGMAEDVDAHTMVFRPYVEIDAIYQVSTTLGVGLKTQITDSERPFAGLIFSYKFGK